MTRKNRKKLLAGLYILFIMCFVLYNCINLIKDKKHISDGLLTEITLEKNDFSTDGIVDRETWQDYTDPFVSQSPDPQLFYDANLLVNNVSFSLRSNILLGDTVIYYKEHGDAEYSNEKRLLPTYTDPLNGYYEFSFNTKEITSLRIDPTTQAGCIMEITDIKINTPKQTLSYFTVDAQTVLLLAITPFILFCFVTEFSDIYIKKERKKGSM